MDDSVCVESGMATKPPHKAITGSGGDQNNQIMVVITQIVYIIVQIVNRMGGSGHESGTKHTKKTPQPSANTTPFDWDKLVEQYSSTPGPELTNTPDWNDLISQIMSQMGSTMAGGMVCENMSSDDPLITL